MSDRARYGWESDFPKFRETPPRYICETLKASVQDASPEQERAWRDSIPPLQREVQEVLHQNAAASGYSTILEYELPMEFRRPDVVFLVGRGVVVVELKGKQVPTQADVDQAAAYARDLRCYHRECAGRNVSAILVPTRATGYLGERNGVHVAGPDAVDGLLDRFGGRNVAPAVTAEAFLREDAYRPLPTLVESARQLFRQHEIWAIPRARAATQPAVDHIAAVIHEAAATGTRRLILLTGVPGAGKTLVGLQTVHARFLDDLAVPRPDGKPTAAGVFLSGNGPLVQVLQYELGRDGGEGKVFVRGVKNYVSRYSARPGLVPPEHVLVFDEAQRAFDAEQVREKHAKTAGFKAGKSEPEHLIEFADRIPGWCVVVGLIGSGQEIHTGEEGGLGQWRRAVDGSTKRAEWEVHGPPSVGGIFDGFARFHSERVLSLDTEIRYHLARHISVFVDQLLSASAPVPRPDLAGRLDGEGFHLRLTRDLSVARAYLRERYREDPSARFGLVASARDRDLQQFGVPNGYHDTKNLRIGPWYGDAESEAGGLSCRHLTSCVTEFGAQGLELDATLVAWGTDLQLTNATWSDAKARRYKKGARIKDPLRLRLNSYRVLLTRGRDACVVFVPPLYEMDETFEFLKSAGFQLL
jgi:hypothetical protein